MASPTAASTAAEVQNLLRFLSQDARIPLPTALSKTKDLRAAKLHSAEAISKSNSSALSAIFSGDEKLAKQILAAAKRVSNPNNSRKRSAAPNDHQVREDNRTKRARGLAPNGEAQSPAELEASLSLPFSSLSVKDLQNVTLQTNRAPLLLAFAVTLIKYTMPEQPLSSRLSLAQAVVSANSRTKAQSIGLVGGKSAEDEGWGQGQPKVRIMGREIPVMRRSGYEHNVDNIPVSQPADREDADSVKLEDEGLEDEAAKNKHPTSQAQANQNSVLPEKPHQDHRELPLWGLDLEALRNMNQTNNKNMNNGPAAALSSAHKPPSPRPPRAAQTHLPIHPPQSARAYLLKSFTQQPQPSSPAPTSALSPSTKKTKPKPPTPSEHEDTALSHLLLALDTLISSWSSGTLDRAELDRRAWTWYVRVRPDVEPGGRGWGQKGRVGLGAVLALCRVRSSE